MCIDPNSANNTLYLSSSHADAYIVNRDKNKVPLPASVDVTSSGSQRSCIYLILFSTRRYEMSGYFIAGTKNASFSFPIQVDSISPFNVTEKDKGKTYMKTYLNETVQFISRISRSIGSMLFQWDFGDGNVTQIERQDGTLTISHAYEKAGCFFATNSWLFLSDNQTVERLSITFQIEVLPSRSTSDMLRGENYLQNSTNASIFWEALMRGCRIGYVVVVKKIPVAHSNETRVKEETFSKTGGSDKRLKTDPKLSVDANSLVVYKHKFDVIAKVESTEVFLFTFKVDPPISIVRYFLLEGRATLYAGGEDLTVVNVVAKEIGFPFLYYGSLKIRPMRELSCFNVTYLRDRGYKLGEPVTVQILACGLDRVVIHYNLTCSGKAIFKNVPREFMRMNKTFFPTSPEKLTCDLEAYIPHKPGVLQKYSAPGVKTLNRQHVFIYSRITSFEASFVFGDFREYNSDLPKGHNVTLVLEGIGIGIDYRIAYLDTDVTIHGVWNKTLGKSVAKHVVPPIVAVPSYRMLVRAFNRISMKEVAFSVRYFDCKYDQVFIAVHTFDNYMLAVCGRSRPSATVF